MSVPPRQIAPETSGDGIGKANSRLQRDYWCFISYRHADNKVPGRQWAIWLHQALETYEVPHDLIGTKGTRGDTIPERIFPVFRDEDEAAADSELSKPIEQALAHSRFLVVLCSPRAVTSQFVAQEIIRFKQLHPARTNCILAAIIAGDPNGVDLTEADSHVPYDARQCYPRPLRFHLDAEGRLTGNETQPLAADFRLPDGAESFTSPAAYREYLRRSGNTHSAGVDAAVAEADKRREQMKLKIIAGILGVPLGVLSEREKAYQLVKARRRQRMITFFALLVAMVLVLAAAAIMQRRATLAVQSEKVKTQRLNAEMTFKKGVDLTEQGNGGPGLLWIARSLDQCPSSAPDLERAIRTTLSSSAAMIHTLDAAFSYPSQGVVATFSPDGKTILVGGGNKASLVDAASGIQRGESQNTEAPVSGGSFSPDGALVVTSTMKGAIRIADAATLREFGARILHDATVKSVVFSPDGRRILVAAQSENLQIEALTAVTPQSGARLQYYDVVTRRPVPPAFACAENIYTAVFSRDGSRIATASMERTAQVWNAASGEPVGPPLRHPGVVFAAAFSPDGGTLATGCLDGGIRFWNIETGRISGDILHHKAAVRSVVFNHDGTLLLSSSEDGAARLWEIPSGNLVGQVLAHPAQLRQAWFSPDETRILTTGFEGAVRIWRIAREQKVAKILRHPAAVAVAAFSPDGRQALTGCQQSDGGGGEARLWDAFSGEPLGPPMSQKGQVMFVGFSPDGKLALTGGNDATARLWHTGDSSIAGAPLAYPSVVGGAAFSPDGRLVALGGRGSVVQLHETESRKQIASWSAHEREGQWVWSLVFSHDGRSLVTGGGKAAHLWSVPDGRPIGEPMKHDGEVHAVLLSPDGTVILTCSYDQTARMWSATDGRPLGPPMVHRGEVRAAAFRADGKVVATASADGSVRLWEAPTGRLIRAPILHDGWVRSVDFSPDGKMLVTGCDDGTARLWDAETGDALGAELRHHGPVNIVAFHPNGRTILTASSDGTARLWTPPQPIRSEPARLAFWVQVLTGMELDADGTPQTLPTEAWLDRRRKLERFGGPPALETR